MKLTQKRPLFGTYEFEVGDEELHVSTETLLSANRFTVALRDLKATPSCYRAFPLQWLIFTAVFAGVAGFSLYGLVQDSWVEDKSGFIGMFTVLTLAAIGCFLVFLKKRVDFVILHAVDGGHPVVFLHRRLPSETHVREFVEILKERIEAARHQ